MQTHSHPKPGLNRVVQYGALGVTLVMIAAALSQVMLAMFTPGGGLILSAILTLLLAAPVLMLTAYAPAVGVDERGITLFPIIWKTRFVPWNMVKAVKVYPLLPTEDAEVTRRITVGRKKYRPAAGIMLVIPVLPPQYRIAGFFAGERAAPVIALTNRAHADYDTLLRAVLTHTDEQIHDAALQDSL